MELLIDDPETLAMVERLAREETDKSEELERLEHEPAWADRREFFCEHLH